MKKLILGIAVAVAGIQLNADDFLGDVLFWQIDNTTAEAKGYSYATLYAKVGEGGEVSLFEKTPNAGAAFTKGMDVAAAYDMAQYNISGGWANSSFFVEYFNDQNEQIGYSDAVGFGTLAGLGYIGNWQSQPVVPNAGVWTPNFVIPEPTSGLLMLIGLAGLALRRKRA